MKVVVRSFYGEGSGVSSDLIGSEKSCLVAGSNEQLLIVAEILLQLAQGCDFRISHFEE